MEQGFRKIDRETSDRYRGGEGWSGRDRKGGGGELETLQQRVKINGGNGATYGK